MSNPAVITLAELERGIAGFKRFQIEDNIGEAIHLHLGPVRVDLTVAEFWSFAEGMRKALNATGRFVPWRVEQFDPMFIMACGSLLASLAGIDIEERAIDDLRCIVYRSLRLGIYSIRPVIRTPVYRFLSTGDKRFLEYEQNAYRSLNNKERVAKVAAEIEEYGYPYKDRYIILFQGQDLVRDGQHRLAAIRHQRGNVKIPVMVFRFTRRVTMPFIPWRSYAGAPLYFARSTADVLRFYFRRVIAK